MKNMILLFALIAGVGCTQDTANNSFQTNTMARPSWISGGIPEIQAVVLSPEESYREPGGASLRGDCDNDYVLQIRRISNHSGNVTLRVFTKDADDEGFSAVINAIQFTIVSSVTWVTILLYDEDNNEICFHDEDDLAFIQPFDFDEDIEFEARLYNVSAPDSTAGQNILWEAFERYYYTMFPLSTAVCANENPDYCCDYFFEAYSVASSEGTMRFGFVWDATNYALSVPPTDNDNHVGTNCGPIVISWGEDDDHVTENGEGELEFECDDTGYNWFIGDILGIHGVLFDPNGRMCFLEY